MKTDDVYTEEDLLAISNKFTQEQRNNGCLLTIDIKQNYERFLKSQRTIGLKDRIEVFPLLVLDGIYNKGIEDEATFIKGELERYYAALDILDSHAHSIVKHNIMRYITFLEDRKLKLDDRVPIQKLNKYDKLVVTWGKTEFTALLLFFLKDSGVVSENITDYGFARWMENSFLFQTEKEMKYMRQEVSKFRQFAHDTAKFEEDFRVLFKKWKIKLNDELDY